MASSKYDQNLTCLAGLVCCTEPNRKLTKKTLKTNPQTNKILVSQEFELLTLHCQKVYIRANVCSLFELATRDSE